MESCEKRLKVLLIAYACEPNRGSEPGTGWNMALGLAQEYDVTVVTRANNRLVIESYLDGFSGLKPSFIYIDPADWVLWFKKAGILPVQLFYAMWQRRVKQCLGPDETSKFDLVHQLTFNSFEVPPYVLGGICAKKVWGPIGGGQRVPLGMLPAFGLLGGLREFIRNLRVLLSAKRGRNRTIFRQCDLVVFANRETRELLEPFCLRNTSFQIDVGVDSARFLPAKVQVESEGATILFAGRLEPRKGLILLLRAFEICQSSIEHARLRVVGDGPDRAKLTRFVKRKKLENSVSFVGFVDHSEMVREFEKADVFAFPSLRDTSGAIVLEAMAMKLPVVCFNHQGAALMVEEGCGIKVDASNCNSAVEGMASALLRLLGDDRRRKNMGERARSTVVEHYDWKAKVEVISEQYRILMD